LFEDLKPLFKNKPIVVVFTKVDLKHFDDLEPESKAQLTALLQ
jgi:nucleolar GTP-binding protein